MTDARHRKGSNLPHRGSPPRASIQEDGGRDVRLPDVWYRCGESNPDLRFEKPLH